MPFVRFAIVALAALTLATPASAQFGGLKKKVKKATGQEETPAAAPASDPTPAQGGSVVLTADVVSQLITGLKAGQAEREAAAKSDDNSYGRYQKAKRAFADAQAKCESNKRHHPAEQIEAFRGRRSECRNSHFLYKVIDHGLVRRAFLLHRRDLLACRPGIMARQHLAGRNRVIARSALTGQLVAYTFDIRRQIGGGSLRNRQPGDNKQQSDCRKPVIHRASSVSRSTFGATARGTGAAFRASLLFGGIRQISVPIKRK